MTIRVVQRNDLDLDAVLDGGKIRFENVMTGTGAPVAAPLVVGKSWLYVDSAELPGVPYYWDELGAAWHPLGSGDEVQVDDTPFTTGAAVALGDPDLLIVRSGGATSIQFAVAGLWLEPVLLGGTSVVSVTAVDAVTALEVGDALEHLLIPAALNGKSVTGVQAALIQTSTSGLPAVQVSRGRQATPASARTWVSVLSTVLTVDVGELDSRTATTPAVINTSNDDVLTGDLLRIDCTVAGTGVLGLVVAITFA